jgi:hypothetical protein
MNRDALEMAVVYGFADDTARTSRTYDAETLRRIESLAGRPGQTESATPLLNAAQILLR